MNERVDGMAPQDEPRNAAPRDAVAPPAGEDEGALLLPMEGEEPSLATLAGMSDDFDTAQNEEIVEDLEG